MRKSFAFILIIAFLSVYALSFTVLWQVPDSADIPLYRNVLAQIREANIAFDRLLWGEHSTFEAREQTALGYTKLTAGKPEEADKLFSNALFIRESHTVTSTDTAALYRALKHKINGNLFTLRWSENPPIAERALDIALHEYNIPGGVLPDALMQCIYAYCIVGNYPKADHYYDLLQDWYKLQIRRAEIVDDEYTARPLRQGLAECLIDRADCYLTFGLTDKAAQLEAEAKTLASKDPSVNLKNAPYYMFEQAQMLMAHEKYDEAVAYMQKQIDRHDLTVNATQRAELQADIAECYRLRGGLNKAKSILEALLVHEGQSAVHPIVYLDVRFDLARIALQQHQWDEAQKGFEQIVADYGNQVPGSRYVVMAKDLAVAAQKHRTKDLSPFAPISLLYPKTKSAPPFTIPPNAIAITSVTDEPDNRIDLYSAMLKHYTEQSQSKTLSEIDRAKALARLSECQIRRGDKEEARDSSKRALDVFDKVKYTGKDYVIAVDNYSNATVSLYDDDSNTDADKQDAQKRLASARAHSELYRNDPLLQARLLIASSSVTDNRDAALKDLRSALRLQQSALEKNDILLAQTLLLIARHTDNKAEAAAARTQAKDIAFKVITADFRKYGPVSPQILANYGVCTDLSVPLFYASSSYDLAMCEMLYGENSPAAGDAAFTQALDMPSAVPRREGHQPNAITLAIPLMFLTMFACMFIFVQRIDASKVQRTPFIISKRWSGALLSLQLVWIVAFAVGCAVPRPKPETEWRAEKAKALLTRAVAAYKGCEGSESKLGWASYELAKNLPDDDKNEKDVEQYLRLAAASYEKRTHSKYPDKDNLGDCYKRLGDIEEKRGHKDEAKRLHDKAFQIERAEDL